MFDCSLVTCGGNKRQTSQPHRSLTTCRADSSYRVICPNFSYCICLTIWIIPTRDSYNREHFCTQYNQVVILIRAFIFSCMGHQTTPKFLIEKSKRFMRFLCPFYTRILEQISYDCQEKPRHTARSRRGADSFEILQSSLITVTARHVRAVSFHRQSYEICSIFGSTVVASNVWRMCLNKF